MTAERHPGTAIHPRAAMFNQRTIELYRSIVLEAEVIEASGLEFEQNGAIVSVERGAEASRSTRTTRP